MSRNKMLLATNSINGEKLTPKEVAFIDAYIKTKNGTLAVKQAGYVRKNEGQYWSLASDLLRQERIRGEIQHRMKEIHDATIADSTEILQFYTSVMRGEVLDQFGIEASLDTRIKAANELARQQIEIPMKLEQKNIQNNIGSIQINFVPREDDSSDCTT